MMLLRIMSLAYSSKERQNSLLSVDVVKTPMKAMKILVSYKLTFT